MLVKRLLGEPLSSSTRCSGNLITVLSLFIGFGLALLLTFGTRQELSTQQRSITMAEQLRWTAKSSPFLRRGASQSPRQAMSQQWQSLFPARPQQLMKLVAKAAEADSLSSLDAMLATTPGPEAEFKFDGVWESSQGKYKVVAKGDGFAYREGEFKATLQKDGDWYVGDVLDKNGVQGKIRLKRQGDNIVSSYKDMKDDAFGPDLLAKKDPKGVYTANPTGDVMSKEVRAKLREEYLGLGGAANTKLGTNYFLWISVGIAASAIILKSQGYLD